MQIRNNPDPGELLVIVSRGTDLRRLNPMDQMRHAERSRPTKDGLRKITCSESTWVRISEASKSTGISQRWLVDQMIDYVLRHPKAFQAVCSGIDPWDELPRQ